MPGLDAPETNNGIAESTDGEEIGTLYGRVAYRNLTVTSSFGRRLKYVPTGSFFTLFNSQEPREQTVDGHAIVDGQYDQAIGKNRLSVDVSFDRWHYEALYPYEGNEDVDVVIGDDSSSGTRWSAGARVTRPLPGRQTLTFGAELLANLSQKQVYVSNSPEDRGFVIDQSSNQTGAYVQDEIRVTPWLLLNGGVRHDRYEQFARTTPRGAVILLPSVNQSIKYLYGRAFRAPNAYELYYYEEPVVRLQPESVATHEVVWEQYLGEWLRTSVSTYRSSATQLLALELLDAGPISGEYSFFNRGTINAKGVTLEGEVRSKRGLQALGNVTLQRAADGTETEMTNSPREMANFRFSAPGPIGGSMGALEVQYVSSRRSPLGTTVPAATVVHLTLSSRVARSVELFGTIRNLFDRSFSDPASEEHWTDSIPQNGRTARIGLRWHLSSR
jgi:iron complex outermembrane receptor protein